jgi:hypothetical protein
VEARDGPSASRSTLTDSAWITEDERHAFPSMTPGSGPRNDVERRPLLEGLDFLYTPSGDVAADVADLTSALGGRVVFAIDDGGVRVAMIDVAGPPRLLLTDHLEGDRPILVYRVADLDVATASLAERGWTPERSLQIPQGPCGSFRSAGGHRIAIYQASRPEVLRHFEGRRDF